MAVGNTVKAMLVSGCTAALALTAVLMVLTGGARGVRVWKGGPEVGPDGREYKGAGLRSEDSGQPLAVSVQCTENSMVVRARADLYGTGRLVSASELHLGPNISEGTCRALQGEDTELVITASLHECGAELRVRTEPNRTGCLNTSRTKLTLDGAGVLMGPVGGAYHGGQDR